MRTWSRYLAVPLLVWLLAVAVLAGALSWAQSSSEAELKNRFALRVSIGTDFVANHVKDLLERERVEAELFLTASTVDAAHFQRVTTAFGYKAAVLLDGQGRLLRVAPANPGLVGQDMTGRYAHLHQAVTANTPAVSRVVPSAAQGVPVVAFAVPYDTPLGRRVFSGAMEVQSSPLGSYLEHTMPLASSRMYLLDPDGKIVAADGATVSTLTEANPALADALSRRPNAQYRHGDHDWFYASQDVPGTPWRLVATVPLSTLFEPTRDPHEWRLGALLAVAVVGLAGVMAAARSRRNRRALADSEQRFRTVFDSSLFGMALTGVDGRLLRVNHTLADMLGRRAEDLVGTHFATITVAEDVRLSYEGLRATLAGRQPGFSLTKRYLHADGRHVPVAMTTTLLRDPNGQPLHFATQLIDITEQQRLGTAERDAKVALAAHAADLESANTQLQAANRLNGDVIAMLSHDIGQPLTTLIGYTEMLDDWSHLSAVQQARLVARMQNGVTRIRRLVTDVLTLVQLDAQAIVARPEPVGLTEAARAAADAVDHPEVTVTVHTDAPALVDPGHLQQILANLIGNALKYGATPVELHVSTGDTDTVEIAVTDHGEGIPEAFVPRLFGRFTRNDDQPRGTGLGLYIVDQLARANDATVAYQPNQPHGSRFAIRMPRADGGRPTRPREPAMAR
ncbi:MAG TPA: ATP-binding protein [Pilimelia sp.]|nr:ATP-binding protein [Pilimelia sp.]